jgi:threonine dehydrogenase-like Zn-dependent dehydrogenase
MPTSEALWYVSGERAEVRPAEVRSCLSGDVRIAARFSGISRGTERLVFRGRVPVSEYTRMRCPHQGGDFSFPVKYGYAMVGAVVEGPADIAGRHVFLLHPHQRETCVPASDVHLLPADVPPRRAALAANMETALNVAWDSGAGPADRILIVGGGVLGLLIAGILAQLPGAEVTVSDPDTTRKSVARKLGVEFSAPAAAPTDCDVVIHTSSTAEGLATALAAAGTEATVVEASWYGDAKVAAPLGEAFHSRRLRLISSQVGAVAASRRPRWDYARRMAAALGLLRDARFDALITGEIDFTDAPRELPKIFADGAPGLMTVLRYT